MDWDTELAIYLEKAERPWDEEFARVVESLSWTDYSAARSLSLDRTLHSLVKSNGGRFKSEVQSKLVLEKLRGLEAHEELPAPQQWMEGFDRSQHIGYLSVQTVFGKAGRYSAYGFILDESGVVAKIKFKVKTHLHEATLGAVDYCSGEVVYRRDA